MSKPRACARKRSCEPAAAQTLLSTISGSGPNALADPIGVAVDTANGSNVLVADSLNTRVQVFTAGGAFVRTIGDSTNLVNPVGVAVDTANGGNVLVSDESANQVQVFSDFFPPPAPTLGGWALAALGLLFGAMGWRTLGRRPV